MPSGVYNHSEEHKRKAREIFAKYIQEHGSWNKGKKGYVVPKLITNWTQNLHLSLTSKPQEKDKRDICKSFHVAFESIHPFVDGNGRVGRLLYNWQRKKLRLPIHTIHTGKEQQEYYTWFD